MIIEWARSSTKLKDTHKDKDPIRVRFPVLYHLLILLIRHSQVHGENVPGAISIVRYAGGCLIRRRLRRVLVETYSYSSRWSRSEWCSGSKLSVPILGFGILKVWWECDMVRTRSAVGASKVPLLVLWCRLPKEGYELGKPLALASESRGKGLSEYHHLFRRFFQRVRFLSSFLLSARHTLKIRYGSGPVIPTPISTLRVVPPAVATSLRKLHPRFLSSFHSFSMPFLKLSLAIPFPLVPSTCIRYHLQLVPTLQ